MRGFAGEDGKDANLCLHCGGPKPKSLGFKPRKFCSTLCCRESTRPAKPWPPLCESCGKDTGQKRGRGGRRRLCDECKRLRKESSAKPRKPPTTQSRKCPVCEVSFDVTSRKPNKTYCSIRCGCYSPAAVEVRRARAEARKKKYTCLCCGVVFSKRRYPSGATSCQIKYCSRECAFEARRRRLPQAIDNRRSGGLTDMLAKWFLSWGDDVYPIVTKCQDCGSIIKQMKGCEKPPCSTCSSRRRCVKCDCWLPVGSVKYARICDVCLPSVEEERRARFKIKRQRLKAKYGRNHRQRCRYYGAPYTPIKLKDIYERDGWTCQICGIALNREWDTNDPTSRTIDHIIPVSLGAASPGHIMSNVRAACHRCNSLKSNSIAPLETSTLH